MATELWTNSSASDEFDVPGNVVRQPADLMSKDSAHDVLIHQKYAFTVSDLRKFQIIQTFTNCSTNMDARNPWKRLDGMTDVGMNFNEQTRK